MPDHGEMVEFDEAMAIVRDTVGAMTAGAETLGVAQAAGRITAEDQLARLDMPPFNKSAMDGYAIGDEQELDRYDVVGPIVQAGAVPATPLAPGQAVKVMTGAPVPDGAVKVIRVEDTREEDRVVTILKSGTDDNICYHGEDVRTGDVIMPAGVRLGALEIANLIACGITEVSVAGRVRLAVISTGDELVDSPEEIVPGRIMNSNGPMLAALGAKFNFDVVSVATAPDNLPQTVTYLRNALAAADIVVLSGGVSVGDYDFVGAAMAELGLNVHFTSVAVKPGRPLTFASAPGKAVFGLPGNPVSVYLMFHVFVLHAAELIGGMDRTRRIAIALERDHTRRKVERVEYVPCRLTEAGTVEPIAYHGSGHLLAMTRADGFFIMPRGVGSFDAGQVVTFVPIGSSVQ